MTRYEAYITLYYALSNEAGKEDATIRLKT